MYNRRMDEVVFTIFEHPVDWGEFNAWMFLLLLVFAAVRYWMYGTLD